MTRGHLFGWHGDSGDSAQRLKKQIAQVSQDPILFSGNIYENIIRGDPDTTEEDVIHSAILANVHDFIIIMCPPDGYKPKLVKEESDFLGAKVAYCPCPEFSQKCVSFHS